MRSRVLAAPVLVLLLALFLLPACASKVDREALWDAGGLAYNNQWYADCIRYNHLFARKFPDDRRAPQAMLRSGFCNFFIGHYDNVIACCGQIEMYHPGTPFHAEAMLLRGLTYVRLGGQENRAAARNTFMGIIKKFPDSEDSERAKDMIKDLDAGLEWGDVKYPAPAAPSI